MNIFRFWILLSFMWLSSSAALAQATFDTNNMLDQHNAVRRNAVPVPNPPLPDLTWDTRLAAEAARHAARCRFQHDDNAGPDIGENLYLHSSIDALVSPTSVVESWASEVRDYRLKPLAWEDQGTGHYTQIVWADTLSVGCGMAICPNFIWSSGRRGGQIWVCRYAPQGNIVGQLPYQTAR